MLRLQRVNSLIFMAGGTFFIGGSTLFFPIMEDLIAHGGWLYITGCMLVLLAALLGTLTAYEMRKTAQPCAAGRWSDEEATMLSCAMYVLGNLTFIVGSVFFFPRILEAGGPAIRLSAVWLFVLGSVIFFAGARAATRVCRTPASPAHSRACRVCGAGALIDLLVVLRAAAAERGLHGRRGLAPESNLGVLAVEETSTRRDAAVVSRQHRKLVEEGDSRL